MIWIVGIGWLVLIVFTHWLHDNPRDECEAGLVYRGMQLYSAIMHRPRVTGQEYLPKGKNPGPLIVVANHTAGIDPILVQSATKFEVRWMMGAEMAPASFDWFWKWAGVILVDREKNDRTSVRTAIRHVEDGGVLGIFPEGAIERPPEKLLPFMAGVGLIVKKTGARVLPVIIRDTPRSEDAMASFTMRSRARIEFMPMVEYAGQGMSVEEIAENLEARFAGWTGWERNAGSGGAMK